MKIEPQGNRVLVKLLAYENDTLELTDRYREVQQMAEVVGVGAGYRLENGVVVTPEVSVGDKVIVEQTGGHRLKSEGEEYMLIESDKLVGGVE